MPILWRYLLRSYFQVFFLCVSSFIAILLVIRFKEIVNFVCSGADKASIILFTAYQIPYILPFAIPISGLTAALILLKRLSHSHELTAARSMGFSMWAFAFPLLLTGGILALINFVIISEVSPRSKMYSKELIYKIVAVNPLSVFQSQASIKMKDAYVDMKALKSGKSAEDVIIILKNLSHERLGVLTAKELSLEKGELHGKKVSFISSMEANEGVGFDHLIIENQATMTTKAQHLGEFLQSADWWAHHDYLPLRMILAKRVLDKGRVSFQIKGAELEIARRFSLALAAFTFTFIGIAFGMELGRHRTIKGICFAGGLAIFFLLAFMTAKSFRHSPLIALLCYLLPHPLIIGFSFFAIKRMQKGVE